MVINGNKLAAARERKRMRMDVAARALGMRKAAYEKIEASDNVEVASRYVGNICMLLRIGKQDLACDVAKPKAPAKPKAKPRQKAPAKK